MTREEKQAERDRRKLQRELLRIASLDGPGLIELIRDAADHDLTDHGCEESQQILDAVGDRLVELYQIAERQPESKPN
jgi:hypothetical protein